jgi:hypothetical protein
MLCSSLSHFFFCILIFSHYSQKKHARFLSLFCLFIISLSLSLSVTRALIHDVVDNAGTTTTAKQQRRDAAGRVHQLSFFFLFLVFVASDDSIALLFQFRVFW